MSEPTLALDYTLLTARVGAFAGWGRGSLFGDPAWSATKMNTIDDCVRSGCRRVYKCTPPYDWSFLHVFVQLDCPPNATTIPLPDDCAGIEGDLIIVNPGNSSWQPRVKLTNPAFVYEMYAKVPTAVGPPQMAGVEQLKGTTLVSGQREQLVLYPAADQDYGVKFQYYVVPDAPSPPLTQTLNFPGVATGNPYVYGGAEHAELFVEACLSVFEERYDDLTGTHAQAFQRELASSIQVDRRSKAQFLGRNVDRSDERERVGRGWLPQFPNNVTYNGQVYD